MLLYLRTNQMQTRIVSRFNRRKMKVKTKKSNLKVRRRRFSLLMKKR